MEDKPNPFVTTIRIILAIFILLLGLVAFSLLTASPNTTKYYRMDINTTSDEQFFHEKTKWLQIYPPEAEIKSVGVGLDLEDGANSGEFNFTFLVREAFAESFRAEIFSPSDHSSVLLEWNVQELDAGQATINVRSHWRVSSKSELPSEDAELRDWVIHKGHRIYDEKRRSTLIGTMVFFVVAFLLTFPFRKRS